MGLETEMEKQIILVGSYTNFKLLHLIVPPSSLKGHLKDSHFLREHTPCQRRWGLCLSKSIRGSFWKNSSPSLLEKILSWRIAFMRLDQRTFSRPLGHVPTLARCWWAECRLWRRCRFSSTTSVSVSQDCLLPGERPTFPHSHCAPYMTDARECSGCGLSSRFLLGPQGAMLAHRTPALTD